jgi:hypothetical protein
MELDLDTTGATAARKRAAALGVSLDEALFASKWAGADVADLPRCDIDLDALVVRL